MTFEQSPPGGVLPLTTGLGAAQFAAVVQD